MPDPAILIRKAEMRDAPAIGNLHLQPDGRNQRRTRRSRLGSCGRQGRAQGRPQGISTCWPKAKIRRGWPGCCASAFAWDDRRNRNFWWLAGAWVDPAWRGRRVFSALFRHLADLARFHKDVAGIRLQLEGHRRDLAPLLAALGLQKTPDELWEILF